MAHEVVYNPSKAKIKEWEGKYPEMTVITLDRETEMEPDPKRPGKQKEVVVDPGKLAYLRKPGRQEIKFAMSKSVKADGSLDTVSPGEVILQKCFLGGDQEIMEDDRYYFRACIEANDYLNKVTGFL